MTAAVFALIIVAEVDPNALIESDLLRVMAVLQQGLQSPEHAAFVGRLNPNAVAH